MKVCGRCRKEKPLEEFFFKNKKTGKRHTFCKECKRKIDKKYYQTNDDRRKKMRFHALRAIYRGKAFVRRVRKLSKCIKCGDRRWYVLDFHHVNGTKEYNISLMVARGVSIERLKKEIRKCEILCANCHREEHFLQGKEANWVEAQL